MFTNIARRNFDNLTLLIYIMLYFNLSLENTEKYKNKYYKNV